jgi:hypothetical protein
MPFVVSPSNHVLRSKRFERFERVERFELF